ncbi:MAG TPA: PaaI family thioesterase [Pyrinomonadaceae bacterium]|nr:PaaI family thioesterase [Pyrinomonadaceae bacterium]
MTRAVNEEATENNAETRSTLSGLEYMQKLAAGELPQSGMGKLMGFKLVEVSKGHAVLSVKPDERHYNGIGIAHGGLAATLLDSATGCAINTMMPAGRIFTTLEMKINYVRPIRGATGEIRCEARVIHAGRRTAYAEGRIVDENGKLYAHGTATCMLFQVR